MAENYTGLCEKAGRFCDQLWTVSTVIGNTYQWGNILWFNTRVLSIESTPLRPLLFYLSFYHPFTSFAWVFVLLQCRFSTGIPPLPGDCDWWKRCLFLVWLQNGRPRTNLLYLSFFLKSHDYDITKNETNSVPRVMNYPFESNSVCSKLQLMLKSSC